MSWVESFKSLADTSGPIIQPMYGVPIVKYGPPPSPTPYAPGYGGPVFSGLPAIDWSNVWTSPWQSPSFSLPDMGHLGFSFPKLMAGIAFIAYLSLMAVMVFGLAFRGGAWYLLKRDKK